MVRAHTLRKKKTLFKYIENFTTRNWKFSDKKLWYFSYVCSKHRLWYSLEPPRQGSSNEYPQSRFLCKNKKNNVYPCRPQFYCIKVGFKGVKNYIGVFSWWENNIRVLMCTFIPQTELLQLGFLLLKPFVYVVVQTGILPDLESG